jgi:3-polyprenyl-4-hydroxybenzoate decarboxylase
MLRLKYIICVDDDIDIYNISDVMYAVATRCDPKIDVTLIEGTMTSWLDPSSGGLSGKVLFDATKKEGFRGKLPYYPEDAMERARQLIAEGMAAKATPGPRD